MSPRMSRAFRRTALTVQKALNQIDPTCRGTDTEVVDGDLAPVFILSVPRSGTTLLYQLMARSMEFSVITNLMALAPRYMLRLAAFSNARVARSGDPLHPGNFGYLPGFHGLSEAGKVLERWFEPGSAPSHRQQVREVVAALTLRTGRPLLVKSLSLLTRLDVVAATLPRARIVRLHRDPRFVVRSLIRAQSNPRTTPDQWAGVSPPGLSSLGNLDTVTHTTWQIAELSNILHVSRAKFDADRVHDLRYEDLCRAPRAVLSHIAVGIKRPFHPSSIPAELETSASRQNSDANWASIERACEEFGESLKNTSYKTN